MVMLLLRFRALYALRPWNMSVRRGFHGLFFAHGFAAVTQNSTEEL